MVLAACQLRHLVHVFLNDGGALGILPVRRLSALEIDVRILGADLEEGAFRPHRAGAEAFDVFRLYDALHRVVADFLHLLNFVRGSESVEEAQKGNLRLEGREMGDKSQIHRLLDGCGGSKGESRVPDPHHVGMVSEDRKRLACKRSCGHMEDCWKHFAGDLVHVWNHEQKPLRCSEGRCESASAQGSVHRASRTSLGLHLYNVNRLAKKVFLPFARPFVRIFAHVRRWCNRIDRRDFAECVRHMRCRRVPVNCYHLASHKILTP